MSKHAFATVLSEPYQSNLVDSVSEDLGKFRETLLGLRISDSDRVVVLFALVNEALSLITQHTNAVKDRTDRRNIGEKFIQVSKLLFEIQLIYAATSDNIDN